MQARVEWKFVGAVLDRVLLLIFAGATLAASVLLAFASKAQR